MSNMYTIMLPIKYELTDFGNTLRRAEDFIDALRVQPGKVISSLSQQTEFSVIEYIDDQPKRESKITIQFTLHDVEVTIEFPTNLKTVIRVVIRNDTSIKKYVSILPHDVSPFSVLEELDKCIYEVKKPHQQGVVV